MTSHTDYGLPPKWSEYLAERDVLPDVARARGYKHVRAGKPIDGDYAAVWGLGRKYSGLLIPLHGLLDPEPPAVQLRLDNPEDFPDGKGEPRRFMTPARQRNVLATSPVTRDRLAQPEELIVVAEGVTRVDALAAHDIPAVGILGINNWRTGRPPTAIGDFEDLGIKGNRFVIAPDGDVRVNKNVNAAVKRLRTLLLGKGADKVFVMALPGTQGLDDWLAASQFKDRDAVGHAMLELCTDSVEDTTPVPPGDVFGIEDAGPWSCTPAADVRRLLEYAPTRFCVVRGAPGRPWRLLVEQEGGRWSSAKDEAAVGQWHIEEALDWQRRVSEAVIKGELASEHAEACTKWAITSAKPAGVRDLLAMVGATYRYMEALGSVPAGLTVCHEEQLDANRKVIGAPNGVISLDTGTRLSVEEARSTFTTRYIPDPFDPAAKHAWADALVAHLERPDRQYLLSAIGYGLRGNPARRLYGLVGERGGGKSTLLAAIAAALGDVSLHGYSMAVDIKAFLASRWSGGASSHQGNLIGLQDARIAVTEEPPERGAIDVALLKDITGGRPQRFRDVGEKADPHRPVKATLIFALNTGQEDVLDTRDSAFADRVRLLRYPMLKVKPDTERITAIPETPEARQAVAALLIRHAVKTRERPDDPPSVAEYTKQRRQDSIGHVGQYIERALRVTGKRRDCVVLDDFIEAVAREAGGRDPKGLIEGLDRKEILALARELVPDLPRAVSRKRQMVWRGVQHVHEDADEDTDDLGERPGCQICGQERDVGDLDTWGQCLDRDECDEYRRGNGPRPAPSADIGHAQGFEGGRDP